MREISPLDQGPTRNENRDRLGKDMDGGMPHVSTRGESRLSSRSAPTDRRTASGGARQRQQPAPQSSAESLSNHAPRFSGTPLISRGTARTPCRPIDSTRRGEDRHW